MSIRDELLRWANAEEARGNPVSMGEIAEKAQILAIEMRDSAIRQARREWAAQASPDVKAEWQAEALDELSRDIKSMDERATPYGIGVHVAMAAKDKRRQAEAQPYSVEDDV